MATFRDVDLLLQVLEDQAADLGAATMQSIAHNARIALAQASRQSGTARPVSDAPNDD